MALWLVAQQLGTQHELEHPAHTADCIALLATAAPSAPGTAAALSVAPVTQPRAHLSGPTPVSVGLRRTGNRDPPASAAILSEARAGLVLPADFSARG